MYAILKEAAEKAARRMAILQEFRITDIRFDCGKYNLKTEAQSILKAGAPAYLKYKMKKSGRKTGGTASL